MVLLLVQTLSFLTTICIVNRGHYFSFPGEYPDILVGCTGGGSNFAGLCFPFLGQKFRNENKKPIKVVAAEPASCPSLTKGVYAYDFGDTVGMTPLMKTHTLGHTFMPPPSHAGGLRYHGMAPLISHLKELGHLEAVAIWAGRGRYRKEPQNPHRIFILTVFLFGLLVFVCLYVSSRTWDSG